MAASISRLHSSAAESESASGGESSSENVGHQHDEQLQDLSDDQIAQRLAATLRANEVLTTETEMFEKYLKRADPRETVQSFQAGVSGSRLAFGSLTTLSSQSDTGGGTIGGSRMSRKSRSKSRASGPEKMLLRLSADQKCDIAQREIEEYQLEAKKINDEAERKLDNLHAINEEAEEHLIAVKQEQYEFDRDINRVGQTKKVAIGSEKVAKYIDDKLRDRESLIVKLHLKNAALKIKKKKLQTQLKQKEEMGEVLQEIDFNQLKIENQQYIERIDERNKDLLRLKLIAGRTLSVLNEHKKELNTLLLESERLKSDTVSRAELLKHIETEMKAVEREKATAESVNQKLRQQLAEYKVPDVMDYVKEKAVLQDLQKQVKSWERKVSIAEMALRTEYKTWHQLQISSGRTQQSLQWKMPSATTTS